MSVALVLLGVGFVLWLYFIWSRRRFYLFSLKYPGPWVWPVIGIASRLRSLDVLLYELAKMAEELNTNSGFSYLGPIPFLATRDPVVVGTILTSPDCLDKPYLYDVFVEALGGGLLTIGSPKCTTHRKMLNPTFRHNILLSFFPIFNEGTDSLIQDLDKFVGKGEFEISSSFYACTLRISIETTMGMDGNQYREKSLKILPYTKTVLTTTMNRLLKPWLRIEAIFRLTSKYKPYMEAKANVDAFVNEILSKKLMQKQNEQTIITDPEISERNVELNKDNDVKKSKNRFIDQAIELYQNNEFDWNDFFGESSTIIYAAFETTANTIHTVLIMLAMHPHYQERLFEEIFSVIPEKDSYINYDDISKLTYLDMVINETLRIASTVPIIARHVGADLYVSDDLTIPKGVEVIIDIFEMHRSKDHWGPHPNDFNPDNFLPENLATKHPFAFIPFSKGTRGCLGWHYARMLLKVVLAKVLRNYRFTTTFPFKDLHFVVNLTLKFKVIPQLEVHRR